MSKIIKQMSHLKQKQQKQKKQINIDECLQIIKVGYTAGLYSHVFDYSTEILQSSTNLQNKHMASIDYAYKQAIDKQCRALKILNQLYAESENEQNQRKSSILSKQIAKTKNTMLQYCNSGLKMVSNFQHRIKYQNKTMEVSAYFCKLIADYNRIIAQNQLQQNVQHRYKQAEKFYAKTLDLLQQVIQPNPIKLGAMVNASLVQYIFRQNINQALILAFCAESHAKCYNYDEHPKYQSICETILSINSQNLEAWRKQISQQAYLQLQNQIQIKQKQKIEQIVNKMIIQKYQKQTRRGIQYIL